MSDCEYDLGVGAVAQARGSRRRHSQHGKGDLLPISKANFRYGCRARTLGVSSKVNPCHSSISQANRFQVKKRLQGRAWIGARALDSLERSFVQPSLAA